MAQQTILIRVRGKRAETDFSELVSFNENSYRLQFDFDGEWADYSQRVAVVLWAGGCREQLFTGTSCDMPAVLSPDCDTALVGVYSADGAGGRIASSFVRLRCLAGAYCEGEESPPASLHEQILELLNKYDFSALEQKVTSGTYSAVDVNAYGFVTGGKQIVEVGEEGQTTPSASLADGGIFIKRTAGGDTLCYYADGVLTPVTSGGGGGEGAVTSVNGQTGDVTISKNDLGLGLLDNERQLPISSVVWYGGNFNTLDDTGCYYVEGSSDLPCYNAPTSNKNSASSCRWFLLTMSHADEGNNITQVAFSLMSDCAIRIRNYSGGSWCAWKTVI